LTSVGDASEKAVGQHFVHQTSNADAPRRRFAKRLRGDGTIISWLIAESWCAAAACESILKDARHQTWGGCRHLFAARLRITGIVEMTMCGFFLKSAFQFLESAYEAKCWQDDYFPAS
jgi:hypothetical protein